MDQLPCECMQDLAITGGPIIEAGEQVWYCEVCYKLILKEW